MVIGTLKILINREIKAHLSLNSFYELKTAVSKDKLLFCVCMEQMNGWPGYC